jgi:hypothetical protein
LIPTGKEIFMDNLEKNAPRLFVISPVQAAIIRRLKRLPEDAGDDDICMALDELLEELSAGK